MVARCLRGERYEEMEMLEPSGITRGLQEIRLQTLQSRQDLHPAAPINCETGAGADWG